MKVTMKLTKFNGNWYYEVKKEHDRYSELICRTGYKGEALKYFKAAKDN